MSSSDDNLVFAVMLVGALVAGGMIGYGMNSDFYQSVQSPSTAERSSPAAIESVEVDPHQMLVDVNSSSVRDLTPVFQNGTELRPYSTVGGRHLFAITEFGTLAGNQTVTLVARGDDGQIVDRREISIQTGGHSVGKFQ